MTVHPSRTESKFSSPKANGTKSRWSKNQKERYFTDQSQQKWACLAYLTSGNSREMHGKNYGVYVWTWGFIISFLHVINYRISTSYLRWSWSRVLFTRVAVAIVQLIDVLVGVKKKITKRRWKRVKESDRDCEVKLLCKTHVRKEKWYHNPQRRSLKLTKASMDLKP